MLIASIVASDCSAPATVLAVKRDPIWLFMELAAVAFPGRERASGAAISSAPITTAAPARHHRRTRTPHPISKRPTTRRTQGIVAGEIDAVGMEAACSKLARSSVSVVMTCPNWLVRAGTACSPADVAGKLCCSSADKSAGATPSCAASAGTACSVNCVWAALSPLRSLRSCVRVDTCISGLKFVVRSLNLGATENSPGITASAISASPARASAIPSAHFLIPSPPCGCLCRRRGAQPVPLRRACPC